ncbi:hypothetical protein HYS90_00845 [Candidatus Curtissbacteria bacterium]|nr:hypothetical protein [Candidatus Curtissbacteria bacterium]
MSNQLEEFCEGKEYRLHIYKNQDARYVDIEVENDKVPIEAGEKNFKA